MVCTRRYSKRQLVHFHSSLSPLGFLLVTTSSARVAVLPAALTFVLVSAQIAKFAVPIKAVVQSARLGQAVWWRPLLGRLGILVRIWSLAGGAGSIAWAGPWLASVPLQWAGA